MPLAGLHALQAAATAIAAALLVGQDSSVVAANAAAFAASNATAIAAAAASANNTARPGVNCLDYSKAYADAVTSVITANPIQVKAAASAVAAAFAQGCAVEEATGLKLTESIYNLGCTTVGPVLLSKPTVCCNAQCTMAHPCRCLMLPHARAAALCAFYIYACISALYTRPLRSVDIHSPCIACVKFHSLWVPLVSSPLLPSVRSFSILSDSLRMCKHVTACT